jgi:hypothetical protein
MKPSSLPVIISEDVIIVRIATVYEPRKYDENRQLKDTYEIKRKKEKKEEQLSFSEILKRTQKYI